MVQTAAGSPGITTPMERAQFQPTRSNGHVPPLGGVETLQALQGARPRRAPVRIGISAVTTTADVAPTAIIQQACHKAGDS